MTQSIPQLPEPVTPRWQVGTWTLTAPDGRTWQADSPLKCCGAEQRERIPPEVALKRIFDALDEPPTQGVTAAPQEGVSWEDMKQPPVDEHVILATSGGHVGEASIEQQPDGTERWEWAGGSLVHRNLKLVAWRRMPVHPDQAAAPESSASAENLFQVLEEGVRLCETNELASKTTEAYNWAEKARSAIALSLVGPSTQGVDQ